MSRWRELLGPCLDGKGGGGTNESGEQNSENDRTGEMDLGCLQRDSDGHEHGGSGHLHDRNGLESVPLRHVSGDVDMHGEGHGAAEREQVASVDGSERESLAGGGGP